MALLRDHVLTDIPLTWNIRSLSLCVFFCRCREGGRRCVGTKNFRCVTYRRNRQDVFYHMCLMIKLQVINRGYGVKYYGVKIVVNVILTSDFKIFNKNEIKIILDF